ncbi:hypothetical protein P691DRAFT_672269 [Macrolepiota fuliginosa MF-IS2]|uniref:Aminoglycoside phosphotransferase domain-containing protein n=1 Tax=Macrolepiota fuliginosa MF-IS2 TaxID=1400762 RepID=A0A9P6C2V5_9AGAR|nr:hypothetical protein P691DRAFT_672269 [Macrolepiota fuliginosa MF-IS2]
MLPVSGVKPLFPPALLQKNLLPCPLVGRLSSTLTKRICFYIHEWLLIPLSTWYCRMSGVQMQPSVFPLPFGLVLKRNPRLREQEGLAMNLARAMGVPAPRFISFGEPPACYKDSFVFPSLLMTQLPGTELDAVIDHVDLEVVREDLAHTLSLMRRFASPWGEPICGVDGGPVAGPLVPGSPLPISADEAAFQQLFRVMGNFTGATGRTRDVIALAEKFFARPPHAIVFTHGDLNPHNIMVNTDGHVCGIFDWEAAAWLPDYWEVSVTAVYRGRPWGEFMDEKVTSGLYAEDTKGYRHVFALTQDALSF